MNVVMVQPTSIICTSSEGSTVYTKESASGGSQLSRQSSDWDDE